MLTGKTFVDPLEQPFSRRGSYICLAASNGGSNQYAKTQLWIATSRIGGSVMGINLSEASPFRQIKVELIKNGLPCKCVMSTTPYELIFESNEGSVRFCLGDYSYGRCYGSDGVTIRLTPKGGMFGMDAVTDLYTGAYKFAFGSALLQAIPMVGVAKQTGGYLELSPDEKGVIDLVFEECTVDPRIRDDYLSYNECVKKVQADFDSFSDKLVGGLPEARKEWGLKAAWTAWGLTVVPDGKTAYKRQMIKMMRVFFEGAFSWQVGMHAFFLGKDPDFSWEQLLSAFDVQAETGRIADAVNPFGTGIYAMKPPVQGLGLIWQMDNYDISKKPVEDLEFLYNGMEKLTNFYLEYRDVDHDCIFENQHAGETGWESGTYQRIGFPLASPDMNAYLALQEEALARLGRVLGKDESVNAGWEAKSGETIQKIIDMFWTEDGWVAMNVITKEKSKPTSILLYCVLVLGKRLPQHIIDRSIELIFDSGEYETEFGLTSEQMSSPYFAHGWCAGSIATPVQALIALAMESCGRLDLAKRVAMKYIYCIENGGLYHIHNPYDGKQEYHVGMFYGENSMFYSGWTAGCYLFLADRYTG